jgi:hypothetical protein
LKDYNIHVDLNNLDNYPIVMIDRGKCSFVTKTRNVQNIGGHIALIVNYEPGPIDNILMIDDGTGSDIVIPAILISQEDGQLIKDYMLKNRNNPEDIQMEIEFEMVIN